MERVIRWVEQATIGKLLGATGGIAAVLLTGTWWAPLAGDVALALAACGSLGLGLWGVRRQRWLRSLPLEVAPVALCGWWGPTRAYRFRVRLGHGRPMQRARARVRYEGATTVELSPVLAEAPVLVGPWTVCVLDPGGVVGPGGRLILAVEAREGEQEHAIEAAFAVDELGEGRFGPGFGGSPVRLSRERWAPVVSS